jgi:hypothetical protein
MRENYTTQRHGARPLAMSQPVDLLGFAGPTSLGTSTGVVQSAVATAQHVGNIAL